MRSVLLWLAVASGLAAAPGVAPAPTIFQTAPGRFEVAALDMSAARRVVTAAEEAWRILAAPLALPPAFSSPVFVRLVPAREWANPAPFVAVVEAGGVVSVQIGGAESAADAIIHRALVRGLLLRLAVARRGHDERLRLPLWLEHGCVGWWRTRADAAQLDALKQATATMARPGLAELLAWDGRGGEPQALTLGAVWLLEFLRIEGSRAGEWPALLTRLLRGEEPLTALTAAYPGRFSNARECELWWGTGWHSLRVARALPTLEAAESRRQLENLSRFVLMVEGRETAPPLGFVVAHRKEPFIEEEIARRAQVLEGILPALHPFYRNAGMSLAEIFASADPGPKKLAEALGAFQRDWAAARELEATVKEALDAWEKTSGERKGRAAFE